MNIWTNLSKKTLQGFGASCGGNVLSSGVSDAEKAEIIKLHNEYRQKLANGQEKRGRPGPQPQAADMEQMVSTKTKIKIFHIIFMDLSH